MPLNVVAKAAITAGMMAANYALTMSRKIEGPRLDDLKVTVADYGTPLPMVWGKRRIEGCPIIWAEPIQEVHRESKTKGGKYADYTYFGTFAIALANHEIDGITRLWFDRHLVLDLSGAGPITPFPIGTTQAQGKGKGEPGFDSANLDDHYAIYLGTTTQEVDERIAATTEAQFGEGSAPAYRGIAYIVFKDLPLEKFGNRIPQVSAEIVREATGNYPTETVATATPRPARLWGFTFSKDYSRFVWGLGDYEIFDTATRSRVIDGEFSFDSAVQATFGMYEDGRFLVWENQFAGPGQSLYLMAPDGLTGTELLSGLTSGFYQSNAFVVKDGEGREHYGTRPWSINLPFYFDGSQISMADLIGVSCRPSCFFTDAYGDVWVAAAANGSTSTVYFYRMVDAGLRGGPGFVTVAGLDTDTVGFHDFGATHYRDGEVDHFVFHWNGKIYAADIETGAINATYSGLGIDVYNAEKQFINIPPGSASIWIGSGTAREISLKTLTQIRSIELASPSNPWGAVEADGIIYDPVNHALITAPQIDNELTWVYLDRIDSGGTQLSAIAGDLADQVGIEDYDFTDLDQTVLGWSATPGQVASILEPLLDAYDSDVRPHDFTIEGVKRGGTASLTLATENFIAGRERYTVKVRQAAELPRALTYSFADDNKDQQPNAVRVDRPADATGAREDRSVDMGTLAGTATSIRALAERHFYRIWNSRREASFGLTSQQIGLEPADLRILELDGEEWPARLVSITMRADDSIATEWVYDDPAVATLGNAPGGEADGYREGVVTVGGVSKGFALDIPLLTDADSSTNPLIYFAASSYDDSVWPGAEVYEEIGGEYTSVAQTVPTSRRASWGYTNGTLADANPWLWDRGNTVNVTVPFGTLVSVTEAEIDANPRLNMALIGDEIVNFTTATLETDGTYTLSGFKRGRRGTEWACGSHSTNDVFLMLGTARDEEAGLSDVGTDLSFKAVTQGRLASSAFEIPVSFTGASLKPYAPTGLSAVKESNGDWTFTWVRRTRVGGAWTGGSTIPLSEASEEYQITVGDGSSSDTKTVTSATYTWDVATQTADTGAEVLAGSVEWSVAQVSDAVGAGFLATA